MSARNLDRIFWGVFAAVSLVFVITHSGYYLIDLSVYQDGGRALLRGVDVYSEGITHSGLPFTYTPFSAMIFAPVSLLPDFLARALLTAGGLGCLLGMMRMLQRKIRPDVLVWWPALAAASVLVFSEPMRQTLRFGQVNLLLAGLVMADVWVLHKRWQGTGVGIAAAVKLAPATSGLYWLAKGNLRAVLTAAGTFAVTVGLGFAIVPSQAHKYWFGGLALDPKRVGGTDYVGNQSLSAFVIRLAGDVDALSVFRLVLSGLALLIALVAARMLLRVGAEVQALAVVVLGGLLASPITWSHHWVWWPVIACGVWGSARWGGRIWRRWCQGLAVVFTAALMIGPIWWVPKNEHKELSWTFVQSLAGESYIVLGILALVTFTVAGVLTRRSAAAGVAEGVGVSASRSASGLSA